MENSETQGTNPLILDSSILAKGPEANTSGRIYPQETFDKEVAKFDLSKTVEEAVTESGSEMTAEEQAEILKQIISQSKQNTLKLYKTPGKQVAKDAERKRKNKNRAAKKSRKLNRKNK